MYCWNCGAKISDEVNFCPECGVDITELNRKTGTTDHSVKSERTGTENKILKIFGLFFGTIIAIVFIGVAISTPFCGLGDYISIFTTGESQTDDYHAFSRPTLVPDKPTPVPTTQSPKPTSTPYRTPTPRPTQTPLPKPTDSADRYFRSYQWSYLDNDWTHTIGISKDAYQYYRNKPHNRENNYAQYALSDHDRQSLKSIVDGFQEAGKKESYSEYDNIKNVVSFVQSLPYTSDSVTTGYDEYPRYPLETLVDNGGDCEDTAILTAALIREMGYGTVLIEFPEHMAVGVKCANTFPGTYYEYQDSRYYYLETTGEGWDIGELPPEYERYSRATIHPMIQVPRMDMSFTCQLEDYDISYAYYRVHCDIENIGSGTALNPVVYISALATTEGDGLIWDQETVTLDNYQEGATGWAEATMSVPRDKVSQIRCYLYGSNFQPVERSSSTFST